MTSEEFCKGARVTYQGDAGVIAIYDEWGEPGHIDILVVLDAGGAIWTSDIGIANGNLKLVDAAE